jgi:hypothetical protein
VEKQAGKKYALSTSKLHEKPFLFEKYHEMISGKECQLASETLTRQATWNQKNGAEQNITLKKLVGRKDNPPVLEEDDRASLLRQLSYHMEMGIYYTTEWFIDEV